jgi:hypothetical protein
MGPALLRSDVGSAAIEVDVSPGRSLTQRARNAVASRLTEHGGKQVAFAPSGGLPSRDVWTVADLRDAAALHRATSSTDDRVAVYVMVVDGVFDHPDTPAPDPGVVGVAFQASAFALFADEIPSGGLLVSRGEYEEAVAVHELGHLFGLVNLTGHGAFHEDADHEGHSRNDGSVMYWALEFAGPLQELFEGGPPSTFDADDRTEMEAIRGSV